MLEWFVNLEPGSKFTQPANHFQSVNMRRIPEGCRDIDITEIDITESDVTENDITENDITESDITESDIT